MNFYWIYDIPNWLFCLLSITVFISFGIAGLFITRKWVRRLHKTDHSHNDIVGYYLNAFVVLYAITLGLVAVGTWSTFTGIQDKVSNEAQVLASICRDVKIYDGPRRDLLTNDMKSYVKHIIFISWPQQQKGIIPFGAGIYLDNFEQHLMAYEPKTGSDQIILAEIFKQFNVLIELRRARLNAITNSLPASIWSMVLTGGFLSIIVTLFFDAKSFYMHFFMTTLLSLLIGLMVFLVGTLDSPFRGSVSVKPAPFILLYNQLLEPGANISFPVNAADTFKSYH